MILGITEEHICLAQRHYQRAVSIDRGNTANGSWIASIPAHRLKQRAQDHRDAHKAPTQFRGKITQLQLQYFIVLNNTSLKVVRLNNNLRLIQGVRTLQHVATTNRAL